MLLMSPRARFSSFIGSHFTLQSIPWGQVCQDNQIFRAGIEVPGVTALMVLYQATPSAGPQNRNKDRVFSPCARMAVTRQSPAEPALSLSNGTAELQISGTRAF